METYESALTKILGSCNVNQTETVPIENAVGRILGDKIHTDLDRPSFNRIAMDGYACKRKDLQSRLKKIEHVIAGTIPKKKINNGECAKVMTGAMLPEGADCVFMVEYSEESEDEFVRFTGENTQNNISPQGEFMKRGDLVLDRGTCIRPQHIAILAGVGAVEIPVFKKVKIGIFSTGNELVPSDKTPGMGQLRDSNGIQLASQISMMGWEPTYYGIARDTEEDIEKLFNQALMENDIVLSTGGVSMGDLDLVKLILKKECDHIYFEEIAIKPGKPTVFGKKGEKFCFGLPGNPVSSFVIFELLVKPLVFKITGHEFSPLKIKMPLGEDFKNKHFDRDRWCPVKIRVGKVWPVAYKGSAHQYSLAHADGLIVIKKNISLVNKETIVNVRPI